MEISENDVYNLFVYYYQDKVNVSLTIKDFVNFVNNEVLTNNDYSSNIPKSAKDALSTLNKFLDKNTITKSMNSTELSSLFGIDENIVKQLLLLKYTTTDNGTTLTIAEYIDFVNYLKNNTNYLDGVDISAINKIAVFAKNENNMNSTKMNKVQLSYIFNNVSNGLVDNVYVGLQLPDDYQMSPQEFISLVIDKISGSIEESSLNNLKLLKLIVDDSSKPSKYTATQIANVLGMNTKQTYQIYGLYDYTKGNTTNWKQTPYQFVKFIIDNSSNPQISTNMNKENLSQLQMAYTIMSSTKNNLKYSYSELSNIVGVNNDVTKMIYTLYASQNAQLKLTPVNFVDFILERKEDKELKGNLNADTVSNLKLVNTVMESVINGKRYSVNEISDLLGLNKDDVKLLYSLYSAKHVNSNMSASLKEFVEFMLKDVVTNEKYSNKIDSEQTLKLNTINGIMNAVINQTEYTPGEIFAIISNLTDTIDENTIEILYIYYGSEKYYQDDWAISIEDFMDYTNNKILADSRFDDFIEDDMRSQVVDAKNTIQDNKEKLVGNNYSRIVMNTKFDVESDEVYDFIQKIYDNLEGTELYVIGDSSMSYEMSKTFTDEFNYISILTMVAIFIVVAITFKSFITPMVLVLIIQCAVYMTMGILGIVGDHVYFIALLIVQSILMGATIDYAIVYASYYLESREKMNVKESVKNAYNKSIHTILTSFSILMVATLIVGQFTTGIVGMLCNTLSQGVLCSTILILFILPGTLAFLDKFVVRKRRKN